MGKELAQITGVGIPILFLLILYSTGFFDQLYDVGKTNAPIIKETVETTIPIIEKAVEDNIENIPIIKKAYCDDMDLVLEAIELYMLENVNNQTNDILKTLQRGDKITACEIKILDKNLTPIYKSNLNFKSINPKALGCNIADCIEKYDLISNP